jgi:Na+/proline symporter
MAYQFPVIGAFWPLTLGLYWRRSTTVGCWVSIVCGSLVWGVLTFSSLGEEFPALLGGFIASGLGQIIGSLLPIRSNRDCVKHWEQNKQNYLFKA